MNILLISLISYLVGGFLISIYLLAEDNSWSYIGELFIVITLWIPLLIVRGTMWLIAQLVKYRVKRLVPKGSKYRLGLGYMTFVNACKQVFNSQKREYVLFRFAFCKRKTAMQVVHFIAKVDNLNYNTVIKQKMGSSTKD